MRDLEGVVGFQWDANNSSKSQRKHAVGSTEAEEVFLNEPLVDAEHSGAEERYHALGRTNHGRVLHITFTLRGGGTLIRVISARDASRKERKRFDEA